MPAPALTLLGRQVLINLTAHGRAIGVAEQVHLYSVIVRVASDRIDVGLADATAAAPFTPPPGVTAFAKATPEEERVVSTGAVVLTPDLLTQSTITAPPDDPRRFERPDWCDHIPGL